MTHLVLLRHAESTSNARDLFAGWSDVELTDNGRAAAARAGVVLGDAGLRPDYVHTSLLRRAVDTASLCLDAAERHWIPVRRSWCLNERHYGALQGRSRADVAQEHGVERTERWRRSFDARPPLLSRQSACEQRRDPKYRGFQLLPTGESLRDVYERVIPYFREHVAPDLESAKTVLVVSHGNTLRALIKHLDNIPDESINRLEIPTGVPLLYHLDRTLTPVAPGGVFLH